MSGIGANMFKKGFTAGAVTSMAVYALYSTVFQHEELETRKTSNIHTRSLPPAPPDDSVQARLERGSDIFKYGIPDPGSQPRFYLNHALSYNQARRTPNWVAEYITPDDLHGPANRKNSNFKMDPNLAAEFSSMNSDYKGSGWSRGHMAPAADSKYSQDAMDETFYLTNILPQDIDNNMNFWNLMEIYCRELATKFSEVRVISGPLMMPNVSESGKQFVQFEVIGKNLVAVPTHLYKVITVERSNDSQSSPGATKTVGVGAFVVPNAKIDSTKHTLKEYQVTLETLERSAGITFLPNLTRSSMEDLCSWDSCQLRSKAELDLFYITKRIQGATTTERLEKSWAELAKRNLKPDENLTNIYNQKKQELRAKDKGQ